MKVLQIIDSLEPGGAERMAVNYANMLAENNQSYLCATRQEGALKSSLKAQVGYLFLNKKSRLDVSAMQRLSDYIKQNNIEVIHAHSSSFFLSILAKMV